MMKKFKTTTFALALTLSVTAAFGESSEEARFKKIQDEIDGLKSRLSTENDSNYAPTEDYDALRSQIKSKEDFLEQQKASDEGYNAAEAPITDNTPSTHSAKLEDQKPEPKKMEGSGEPDQDSMKDEIEIANEQAKKYLDKIEKDQKEALGDAFDTYKTTKEKIAKGEAKPEDIERAKKALQDEKDSLMKKAKFTMNNEVGGKDKMLEPFNDAFEKLGLDKDGNKKSEKAPAPTGPKTAEILPAPQPTLPTPEIKIAEPELPKVRSATWTDESGKEHAAAVMSKEKYEENKRNFQESSWKYENGKWMKTELNAEGSQKWYYDSVTSQWAKLDSNNNAGVSQVVTNREPSKTNFSNHRVVDQATYNQLQGNTSTWEVNLGGKWRDVTGTIYATEGVQFKNVGGYWYTINTPENQKKLGFDFQSVTPTPVPFYGNTYLAPKP